MNSCDYENVKLKISQNFLYGQGLQQFVIYFNYKYKVNPSLYIYKHQAFKA